MKNYCFPLLIVKLARRGVERGLGHRELIIGAILLLYLGSWRPELEIEQCPIKVVARVGETLTIKARKQAIRARRASRIFHRRHFAFVLGSLEA